MKKILGLILLLFVLTGCIMVEDSQEFKDLSNQFDQLVINDLQNKESFDQFYNNITMNLIPANIKIHVKIYSEFGFLVENRFGSGFIYKDFNGSYGILTMQSLISVTTSQSFVIDAYDYLGNKYSAQNIKKDDDNLLFVFEINKSQTTLQALEIKHYVPIIKEPIYMIGNTNHTQNSILFGFYLGLNANTQMTSSIPTDVFANGSPILNVQNKVIGIQTGFDQLGQIILDAKDILIFLDTL